MGVQFSCRTGNMFYKFTGIEIIMYIASPMGLFLLEALHGATNY